MEKNAKTKPMLERCGVIIKENEVPTYLKCIFCKGISVDPYELKCEHGLICEGCITYTKCCLMCNNLLDYQEAFLAKHKVQGFKAECLYCPYEGTVSEVREHVIQCTDRIYECKECKYEGSIEEFVRHLEEKHAKEIVQEFTSKKDEDLLMKDRTNDQKKLAKIGSTGKYYCEDLLGNVRCACGCIKCGPISGCNCKSCMKLDLQIRNLPKGFLVNSEGVISQFFPKEAKYACGRLLNAFHGTKCLPTEQCFQCNILNMVSGRYND